MSNRESHDCTLLATNVIRTSGCYLVVFDRQQVKGWESSWQDLLQQSLASAKGDSALSLFHLNELLGQLGKQNRLLSWTLFLDGVFRVDLSKVDHSAHLPLLECEAERFIGEGSGGAFLDCPSGELIIASASELGSEELVPSAKVRPGRYLARLIGNPTVHAEHELLERIEDYPLGDGPDWMVYLERRGYATVRARFSS